MNAFGLLLILAAIFIIFNSTNIREVLQGKSKLNLSIINRPSSSNSNQSTSAKQREG